jgi:tRNA 2-thiouridine synthesizing protein E
MELTEQGFLRHASDWNDAVAVQLAAAHAIQLSPAHWEILHFMRDYYQQYQHLPNSRVFVKAIANSLGADKGNSRYLQQLFPERPLFLVCQIAGLPKPPTCL